MKYMKTISLPKNRKKLMIKNWVEKLISEKVILKVKLEKINN